MRRERGRWEFTGFVKRGNGVSGQSDHFAIYKCKEEGCSRSCEKWRNLSKEDPLPTHCKEARATYQIETILQCSGCTAIQGCEAREIPGGSLRRNYCASCPEECDARPKGISRISHVTCQACIVEMAYEAKHPENVRFYEAVITPGRA
jgi:hypothetical protein